MTWSIPFSMAVEIASDVLLKGTAVLLVASAVTWLLRTKSAAIRHGVWSLAFVVLLALPILAGVLPSWRIGLFQMSVPAEVMATQSVGVPTVDPSALRADTRTVLLKYTHTFSPSPPSPTLGRS